MITNDDFAQRVSICEQCPVFNSHYRTCGPPTNAFNPFRHPQQIGQIVFKPCGCPIDHLASYAVTDCPAKQWPKVVSDEWKVDLLAEIKEMRAKDKIEGDQVIKMFKIRKEYMGINDNKTYTNCDACIGPIIDRIERRLIEDLKKAEQAQALIELTNLELTTEPIQPIKKRRAKRKKL